MMVNANDSTGVASVHNLCQDQPTAPLQADYQAFLTAPVASVYDAVAAHERYSQFVPNLKRVTVTQSEQGLIRCCDFGNDMICEERVLLCQPPSVYAYAAIAPNPFGLRAHYAIATCQLHENGTRLRWRHYFEHDDLIAMLTMLNTMFDYVFAGLFAEFGGHRL